ncbi:MAG: SDR family NAD(P)-dependent oxidoreductase [Planctomycetota bacterium]|jgi:NAD(P)-dependent dehydrogenase (short-subunit alcohol dehydrogenase family)|nr:SDR family NAD(P)-dependent oxidoreductase [Planctomycetota bacterium]
MSTSLPIALITGAARGIGFGIAEEMCAAGWHVVINDINQDAAAKAAAHLRDAGHQASHHAADVSNEQANEHMLDAIEAAHGPVTALVNNAGICPFVDVMEIDRATFSRTLEINLVAPFLLSQAAAKRMIAHKLAGRIVFITSLSEDFTNASQGDYAASKAGLRMLMKAFALALGPHGITCNAVAPGHVLTEMTRHHWEQAEPAAYIKTRVPLARLGQPRDIGRSVVYLAAASTEYVSGITLTTDGGFSAANN